MPYFIELLRLGPLALPRPRYESVSALIPMHGMGARTVKDVATAAGEAERPSPPLPLLVVGGTSRLYLEDGTTPL